VRHGRHGHGRVEYPRPVLCTPGGGNAAPEAPRTRRTRVHGPQMARVHSRCVLQRRHRGVPGCRFGVVDIVWVSWAPFGGAGSPCHAVGRSMGAGKSQSWPWGARHANNVPNTLSTCCKHHLPIVNIVYLL